jgi:hypothetical protein
VCSGKCADTTTDGANGGACGHDCLGGACVASACQPILLTTTEPGFSLNGIGGPAVDATNVYWTAAAYMNNGGAIFKVPITGGTAAVITEEWGSSQVVVEANYIYATSGNTGVVRWPTTGGSQQILWPGSDGYCIAVDATSVYWADMSSIWKAPIGGGMGTTIDPRDGTLTVLRWMPEGYLGVISALRGERVCAEPFDAVEFRVGVLFGDDDDAVPSEG